MAKPTKQKLDEARKLVHSSVEEEWYRQKLIQQQLDNDRAQRELMGDWDMPSNSNVKFEKRSAVDAKLAPSDAYHHSHSQQQCPHCFSTSNISSLGEIIVDGGSRPALLCGSCNRVFSDLPDGVKILLDAAVKDGAESVGFRAGNTDQNSPAPMYNNYDTQQTNQKLDQVNNNLNNMVNTIQNLMYQVETLASQNTKMMEQLANDPLIHMRKTITEFNLK